jgi:hypothetical protein
MARSLVPPLLLPRPLSRGCCKIQILGTKPSESGKVIAVPPLGRYLSEDYGVLVSPPAMVALIVGIGPKFHTHSQWMPPIYHQKTLGSHSMKHVKVDMLYPARNGILREAPQSDARLLISEGSEQ